MEELEEYDPNFEVNSVFSFEQRKEVCSFEKEVD